MFVFISIALLSLTALVMLVLRLTRKDFGYHWLIASGGAFVAWVIVILAGINLPNQLQLSSWDLRTAYPNSISFSADQLSWSFALVLGTLIFATLITDVVRAYDLDWSNWASSLLITAIGLIGILSENLFTFIMAWTAFDVITAIILLMQLPSGRSRRQAVYVFFVHLLGTGSLLIAGVISINDNNSFLLERASPNAMIFIVLTAGFRLFSIPPDSPLQDDPVKRRSLGTVMSLVSAAIVIVFLVRVAVAFEGFDLITNPWSLLFGLVGLVALLSAAAWLIAKDELDGRHAWISAMGAFVLAAALHSQPEASLAWGIALLFSGGLIFLASVRKRFSLWLTLLGLIGIATLPFTPAWNGLGLFSLPLNLAMILYLAAIVLMVWGFARHAFQINVEPPGLERWIRVVYPLGLLIILVVHFGWGLLYRPAIGEIPLLGWILGIVICVLSFLGFMWQRRGGNIPQNFSNGIIAFLDLGWFFGILRILFAYVSRLIFFISSVLEGEGGILWVLLWVVLFLAILLISLGT
jgi:hypothetical protein